MDGCEFKCICSHVVENARANGVEFLKQRIRDLEAENAALRKVAEAAAWYRDATFVLLHANSRAEHDSSFNTIWLSDWIDIFESADREFKNALRAAGWEV
jgi:hypothetical protein